MSRPVDAVIEFLKAEQARGKTHILLDDEARSGLRELYMRTRGQAQKPAAQAVGQAQSQAPPVTVTVREDPTPAAAPAPATIKVTGSSKDEQLASLRAQAESWPPIKALGTLRDTMVFATGNPNADLMLVGEAPGYEEERKKEPFAGPAGQKLNDILMAMGLSREQVYISNIVKFRPATARQTTNNRKPTAEEMTSGLEFVREEIKIIQPSCIIALGATAAEGLLGLTGSISSMRGSWHTLGDMPALGDIPVRVSHHPSHLLKKSDNNDAKRSVWEDMLAVMEKLNLPISEKQRRYFLPKS